MTNDTIAAIATAPGQGGVAIVRMSGPDAERILMALFHPARSGLTALTSHLLTYGHIMDGPSPVDECMAVLMRAPRSYTREDVAELQLHGGGFVAQKALALCLRHGARLAEPGEFTRRAFLSGRVDLSQAEAVMSLIAAQGEQAHRAAMNQLAGGASTFIRQAADELYDLQAGVAACIDYPEEISEEEAAADLSPRVRQLAQRLDAACDERASRILSSGLRVALCGQPNVGKSSLLNALLGEERAIVTPIPGTTRDMVSGDVTLSGSVVHLTDTAGLHVTDDPVERLGVTRARQAIEQADAVLAVFDGNHPFSDDDHALLTDLHGRTVALLINKSDLPQALDPADLTSLLPDAPVFRLSANHPDSLGPLKTWLADQAAVSDRLALTQPRHLDAARRAAAHLRQAADMMEGGSIDLCSIDLQAAQLALAEITGDQVEERLLDRVFSTFCVGK